VIQSKYFWFSAAESLPLCELNSVAGGFFNVDDSAPEFKGGCEEKVSSPEDDFRGRSGALTNFN